MKVLYESQDLWSVVENGLSEPANQNQAGLTPQQTAELKENKKKDKKVLFFIYQAVDETIFERISTSTSSKDAWVMLYKCYRGERLQTLGCEFNGLKMKESEDILSHT